VRAGIMPGRNTPTSIFTPRSNEDDIRKCRQTREFSTKSDITRSLVAPRIRDASLTLRQSIFSPLSGLEAVRAGTVPSPLQIRTHNQEMQTKTATPLALASCLAAPNDR
jgi:hypothetical protein